MKLLISKSNPSSLWEIENDGRATRLVLPDYYDRDLCPPSDFLRSIHLPIELVDRILLCLLEMYIETWNFDLCNDLLFFSKSFTGVVYRAIYENTTNNFYKQFRRLSKTFMILEKLYDQFLSIVSRIRYPCIKLTSRRERGSNHQPWDFTHDLVLVPIVGIVVDVQQTQYQVEYGHHYGESVWLSGNWMSSIFNAVKIKTPVLNIMFVDVFDTLIHSQYNVNQNYHNFFRLIKIAFGSNTGLFVMVKEEEGNPFISRSDLFLEI